MNSKSRLPRVQIEKERKNPDKITVIVSVMVYTPQVKLFST